MNRAYWMNWMKTIAGALAGLVFAAGCGEGIDSEDPIVIEDAPETDDGVVKGGEKGDAWNWRNNPSRFRTELDYSYENLPLEGASETTAWAASYWPYYQDGINYRWQGHSELSPAEKYDTAFNGWEPGEDFMSLRPYDASSCEWDEAYYAALGPAASWTDQYKGNHTAHNGQDDDGDGLADAEECGWGTDADYDGVETWWGICHAWAPAAIMEDEPIEPVTRNGVTFDVSDMKGLLIQQYDRASAYMLGGRCNDQEVERDETGRITRSECRDLNAGTWHVIVTNFLGKNSRPFIIERIFDYEVWNQPLVGYEITEQREITVEEAHDLLNVSIEEEVGGEIVHGVRENTPLARGILTLANEADFVTLDDDVRLDRRAAENITLYRPFDTLAELDDVSWVASRAFGKLETYAQSNGYVEEDSVAYEFNPNATRFLEVRMTTDWVTESHQSTEPREPVNDRYVRHDHYHYIVELDDDGMVVGGEWVGSSITEHPDFVWLPVAARGGNPHLDIDVIRDMIRESRQGNNVDPGDGDTDAGENTYTSEEVVAIPDNDPAGASSTIGVSDSGSVKSVALDLAIDHTYRGDLYVELAHGGTVVEVYDGADASSPWSDNLVIEGQALEGFLGSTLDGEWELRVYDQMGWDTGSIQNWSLTVQAD